MSFIYNILMAICYTYYMLTKQQNMSLITIINELRDMSHKKIGHTASYNIIFNTILKKNHRQILKLYQFVILSNVLS